MIETRIHSLLKSGHATGPLVCHSTLACGSASHFIVEIETACPHKSVFTAKAGDFISLYIPLGCLLGEKGWGSAVAPLEGVSTGL